MDSWKIENDFYQIELAADGAVSLAGKCGGGTFHSDVPFRFTYGDFYSYNIVEHAKMRVRQSENALQIDFSRFDWKARFPEHSYMKPDPGPNMRFSFRIELKDDAVIFTTGRILGLDDEQCSVEFPYRLCSWQCSEPVDAVIMYGYGQIIRYPRENEFFDFNWGFWGMPIHGVFKPTGGFGVRNLDQYDSRIRLCNGTLQADVASIETSHLFNRRFANYSRRLLWRQFSAGSNFLELAKWYRGMKIAEGAFVPFAEKFKTHPNVEKLSGAVIWKHSVYSQKKMPRNVRKDFSLYALSPDVELVEGKPDRWNAYELFDKAHKNGFDRLCVFNAGWNRFGYDSGYPTRLPVNPERGTNDDFRKAAEYARSLSKDYIYSVHDNYIDVYANSPEQFQESLRIAADGAPVKGGIWRGGRAMIQCTAEAIKYARRDIPKVARMLGKGSIYIDVLGSSALRECYSEKHPVSRRQDLKNRRKLMAFIRDQMGSLASEAVPNDATVDLVDLGAYLSSAIETPLPAHIPRGIAIPLWQLVYHDSTFCFTNAYNKYSALNYHAFCALFGLLPGGLDETSLRLSRELRKAYCSEMTSFRFLSVPQPPYSYVAESTFADGTRVVANMTESEYSENGISLPPHGFVILKKTVKQ